MWHSIREVLRGGMRVFTEHPQLWLTVVVAVFIVASYLYSAQRFIGIAQDAQDSLTNVRVGSMQDAFAPLAGALWSEPDRLRGYMTDMVRLNPTITNFYIAQRGVDGEWRIALAADPFDESSSVLGLDLLFSLALADTTHSYTVEEAGSGGRFFLTMRTVIDGTGNVLGVAVTRQALSEADKRIGDSIRQGMITLVVILLLLLLLFFRHARIIDYIALYTKLKEVDQMKNDFISMASHELRTPLTAIRGYADILKTAGAGADNNTKTALERIDISAVELDHLIADILDVARIEGGGLSFAPETIDPCLIMNEVCVSLEPRTKQKSLALVNECTEGMKISVDPTRFRQVMINLMGNAVKYTPKGEVRVKTYREGSEVVFRVSDSGIGMTAEEQKNLFGKFYRVGSEEVRRETGTGLGLWITKQLVERMGGHISVESIKGVGSHFIVRFPVRS